MTSTKKSSEFPPILTTTDDLAAFCARAMGQPYMTVDTEFLRERTYYAKLCLIQLALPGQGADDAVLVDPLSGDLSLDPLYQVFRDPNIVKVFHAARQDLEIFYVDADIVPAPLFDTQIAAMVCGYGDQVGYETLVRKIARTGLDKSSRFTDWSQRPLSAAQKTYALADVTHLRQIYEYLADELQKTNRAAWVEEELSVLTDPSHYVVAPEDAWKRVKFRSSSGKTLAIIRELAQFRETYAQTKNIPRNRVFKDDALMELASTKPKNMGELSKSRLLLREARKGAIADGIIAAIARGVDMPRDDWPDLPSGPDRSAFNHALIDLLRVLLKAKSEDYGVAAKLLATASDLDDIAGGATTGPWATGWRFDVFGKDALRLARGEIALSAQKDRVAIVPV